MARTYTLKRSRRILQTSFVTFRRKKERLSEAERSRLSQEMRELGEALEEKNRKKADEKARKVQNSPLWTQGLVKGERRREFVWSLLSAFFIVFFLIRPFWFELYEVPTGSMRPTILELDRLVVSRTTFGIYLPFIHKFLFFRPDYIQRAGGITFSTADLKMADPDYLYFGLFKGKKRLVKRSVCKPGDTLYFYGGLIYGRDKEGKQFTELSDIKTLKKWGGDQIEHIPFISFGGRPQLSEQGQGVNKGVFATSTLQQMALPIVRLHLTERGDIVGKFFDGKQWRKEDLLAYKEAHTSPVCYSDLWGIGNFAESRLLLAEQAARFYPILPEDKEAVAFLELFHTPNLTYPKPEMRKGEGGFVYPTLTPFRTLLPLHQRHIERLIKIMTTSRFCIENGLARPYNKGRKRGQSAQFDPRIATVDSGCYEFSHGKGYSLLPAGFRLPLPATHPLYSSTPENVAKLFNQGVKWNLLVDPLTPNPPYLPGRYAYYREGALYVMGEPLMEKEDPLLQNFVQEERKKELTSLPTTPYIAFVDRGAPQSVSQIEAFGLSVPDTSLVALGDNYASSSDSRDFGLVPVENLRGAPSFIFWPLTRMGFLTQPPYPLLTLPNLLVWSIAFFCFFLSYLRLQRKRKKLLDDVRKL